MLREGGTPQQRKDLDRILGGQGPKEAFTDEKCMEMLLDSRRSDGGRQSAANLLALSALKKPKEAADIIDSLSEVLTGGVEVDDKGRVFAAKALAFIAVHATDNRRHMAFNALKDGVWGDNEEVNGQVEKIIEEVERLNRIPRRAED